MADELRIDADTKGVVVIDLGEGTTAAGVGFQKGDVILAVNNQKIAKTSDLEKATRESARLWRIIVVRGGQQINVTLGGLVRSAHAKAPTCLMPRGWSRMRRVRLPTGCARRALSEVVGQEHLLGPDGPLTRMVARGRWAR